METENAKLDARFQEFLEKEFSPVYELNSDMVIVMKVAFKAGALAGADLFVEYYEKDTKEDENEDE